MINEQNPAYITIVEGPPPDFYDAPDDWTGSLMECNNAAEVALCEMRTFNGPSLVKRCQDAWREDRPARLDFPTGEPGEREELDIVAVRWEKVEEGHKLFLWLRL